MQLNTHILTREALIAQYKRQQAIFYPEFSDSITEIEPDAFSSLTSGVTSDLTIPDRVTKIGKRAFAWRFWLRSIKLPAGLKVIEESTFFNCDNLNHIEFPKELECIEKGSFACCGVKTVMFPNKLKRLETGIFHACDSLKAVFIPESLQEIDDYAFSGCCSSELIVACYFMLMKRKEHSGA